MKNFHEMLLDEFFDTYRPIANHFNSDSEFDGRLFATDGEEYAFVEGQDPNKVWLFGDGNDGGGYIWSQWGYVNKLGYLVTEQPCPEGQVIQVKVNDAWYYCENCEAEHSDPDGSLWEKFSDIEKCPSCVTPEELEMLEEDA